MKIKVNKSSLFISKKRVRDAIEKQISKVVDNELEYIHIRDCLLKVLKELELE